MSKMCLQYFLTQSRCLSKQQNLYKMDSIETQHGDKELWLHFVEAAGRKTGVEETKSEVPCSNFERNNFMLDYYRRKTKFLKNKITELESTAIYQESIRSPAPPQGWGKETYQVHSKIHRIKLAYYTNKEMLDSFSKGIW